jgi:hypothetical protein
MSLADLAAELNGTPPDEVRVTVRDRQFYQLKVEERMLGQSTDSWEARYIHADRVREVVSTKGITPEEILEELRI